MLGASRSSLAHLSEALGNRPDAGMADLSADLYAVAGLLDREKALRSALADSGTAPDARAGLVRSLLGQRVGPAAVEVTEEVARQRWSDDGDIVLGIEALAAEAAFAAARADGSLDATEEEIFRFGRAVDASAELQMALTDPALSADAKAGIVTSLLAGRSTDATRAVLSYAVGHLHGRRIDTVVDELTELAARQRSRIVAEVRVALPLTDEQRRRLVDILGRLTGREIRLNEAVDPTVLGGALVTVGDEVIDGTVATRLEQARRAILG